MDGSQLMNKRKGLNILVFIKQVINSEDIQTDPVTGNFIRTGMASILNPVDKNAIEEALKIRDAHGGSVSAITMGPPQAQDVLNNALALGCDKVYLLSDSSFAGSDTLATGYVLAKAAEKIGDFDLLLFGRNSMDAATAQTGPITAEFLGLPQATLVTELEIKDGWAYCTRTLEDNLQVVRVKLPAVISVNREINTPRFPTPRNVLNSKNKPRFVWDGAAMGCDRAQVGAKGSPSRTKSLEKPPKRAVDTEYFEGTSAEIAVKIADFLQNEHLI